MSVDVHRSLLLTLWLVSWRLPIGVPCFHLVSWTIMMPPIVLDSNPCLLLPIVQSQYTKVCFCWPRLLLVHYLWKSFQVLPPLSTENFLDFHKQFPFLVPKETRTLRLIYLLTCLGNWREILQTYFESLFSGFPAFRLPINLCSVSPLSSTPSPPVRTLYPFAFSKISPALHRQASFWLGECELLELKEKKNHLLYPSQAFKVLEKFDFECQKLAFS